MHACTNSNYYQSLVTLMNMLTANNIPDAMIKPFAENRFNCLYFMAYMYLCVYFTLNLITATIYGAYLDQRDSMLKTYEQNREKNLTKAYEVLTAGGDREGIEFPEFQRVLKELSGMYGGMYTSGFESAEFIFYERLDAAGECVHCKLSLDSDGDVGWR